MATLPLFGWDFVGERAEAVDGERYLGVPPPMHPLVPPALVAWRRSTRGGRACTARAVPPFSDHSERVRRLRGCVCAALLEMHAPKRFEWHTEAAEHSFTYMAGDEAHTVYYPSVKAVAERLGMLRSLGVGVALWELGTGLDFFWDLL
jgi:hypothetical protein